MISIRALTAHLEQIAPPVLQESYDNSGLLAGDPDTEVSSALLSLDCTEAVIDEAIAKKCGIVICHHPIIFGGIKKLTGSNYVERTLLKAIRNHVAIYAIHTNLDNVLARGVNGKIAEKLKLTNCRVLQPKAGNLLKLVTFVPREKADDVSNALSDAGAGHIGNYSHCSFRADGTGTFKALEGTAPYVGKINELHREAEVRVELIVQKHRLQPVLDALFNSHPYEEIAYDLYPIENKDPMTGSGLVGELATPVNAEDFPAYVKEHLGAAMVKATPASGKTVSKVALCGGSGSFLLKDAIRSGAQAFVTADFRYHQYFDADGKLMIVDPGHYETEKYTPELLKEILNEKFSTFAAILSELNTNPVNYY